MDVLLIFIAWLLIAYFVGVPLTVRLLQSWIGEDSGERGSDAGPDESDGPQLSDDGPMEGLNLHNFVREGWDYVDSRRVYFTHDELMRKTRTMKRPTARKE